MAYRKTQVPLTEGHFCCCD